MFVTLRVKKPSVIIAAVAIAFLFALPYLINGITAAAEFPEKLVCITLDDGPSSNTPEVLEVLDKYGVKATFFVTGQNEDFFGYIGEAHERGHLIALHTYTHDFADIYRSDDAFWNDIARLQEVVIEQTGQVSNILRFPGGSSNTVSFRFGGRGIMKELISDCEKLGITYHDWNVDTKDAENGKKSADYIANRAIKGALKEDIAIILMHDGTLGGNAAEALDIIIPRLTEEGYRFARLDEVTMTVHHSLS